MHRIGFALLALFFVGCSNGKTKEPVEDDNYSYSRLAERFKKTDLPYSLSDTSLLKKEDTSSIRFTEFAQYLDTIKTSTFGKAKVKYTPLAMLKVPKGETYFVVKATGGNKTAAYLLAYNKEDKFGAVFPFLIPDNDPLTHQVTTIDKMYSITRTVIKKASNDIAVDRKEVYGYDVNDNKFRLILTDMFDDAAMELINLIDTLPKTHKYAGDYYLGKKSLVSIRDGRSSNQLNVFIHLNKNNGECTGELKGEILLKESQAAFRQSGNPCVVSLKFGSNSVSLKEEGGCGSSRGMDCSFDGTYTLKKLLNNKSSKNQNTKSSAKTNTSR